MPVYSKFHLGALSFEDDKLVAAVALTLGHHGGTESNGVGLAWGRHVPDDGKTYYNHTGGTFGFRCFALFCPEKDLGVVMMSNVAGSDEDLNQLTQIVWEILNQAN